MRTSNYLGGDHSLHWHFLSDRPIYAQLVEQIQLKILSGEYTPGQKLPALRELSAEAAVNPNTLLRAFEELEQRGLVYTQRTEGHFISEEPELIAKLRRQYAEELVKVFLGQMHSLGYSPEEVPALVTEMVGTVDVESIEDEEEERE